MQISHAGHGLRELLPTGHTAPRPFVSVAVNRYVNDARLCPHDVGDAETLAFQRAGAVSLRENVGLADKLTHLRPTGVRFEIDVGRSFAEPCLGDE